MFWLCLALNTPVIEPKKRSSAFSIFCDTQDTGKLTKPVYDDEHEYDKAQRKELIDKGQPAVNTQTKLECRPCSDNFELR